MLRQARIIWMVCFALLLGSTPLVIKDVTAISDGITIAGSVDYWYESQISRQLLNMKMALKEMQYQPTQERFDKARQVLDIAFSGLSNLPREGGKQWHEDSITNMVQIEAVRRELNAIDNLFAHPEAGYRGLAVAALGNVDTALEELHDMAMEIMYRRNERVGQTDRVMSAFKDKLVFNSVAVLAIVASLAYLMHAHIRSERCCRPPITTCRNWPNGCGSPRTRPSKRAMQRPASSPTCRTNCARP